MAKSPLQAADAHAGGHHIVPTMTYVITLILLTFLMIATVVAAKFDIQGIGPISGTIMNQTVALVIAITKACLVVFIFMGVKWGTTLTKTWAATGFIWFFLLGLILIDYPMRAFETSQGWEGLPGASKQNYDGSALPRVVPPASEPQPLDEFEKNLRPRG